MAIQLFAGEELQPGVFQMWEGGRGDGRGDAPHPLHQCKQGFAGMQALLWKEVSRCDWCFLLGS